MAIWGQPLAFRRMCLWTHNEWASALMHAHSHTSKCIYCTYTCVNTKCNSISSYLYLNELVLSVYHEQAFCMTQYSLGLQFFRSFSSSECRVLMPFTSQPPGPLTLSDVAVCLVCGSRAWGRARKASYRFRNTILLPSAKLRIMVL